MAGELSIHIAAGSGTLYALIFDENRTKIWDGSAFTAISSIADANYADGAVELTEQVTSDSTATGVYVGDFPAGITTQGTYLVEAYVSSPSPGDQNISIQFYYEVGSGISAASVTADDLKRRVGIWLGIGASGWDSDDEDQLDDLIISGRSAFYWHEPIGGQIHKWSFLSPVDELDVTEDDQDFDLPADFGCFITGSMYFAAGDNRWFPLKETTIGEVLRNRSMDPSAKAPERFCIVPDKNDGTAAQTWTLMLDAPADGDYTLSYQYEVIPSSIGGAYHYGGTAHYETLVASCLAQAERMYRPTSTDQRDYFARRLAASIEYDKRHSPRFLGSYRGEGDAYPRKRADFVTFGSVLYDARS